MEFGNKADSFNFGGSLTVCITFMQNMNVMQAVNVKYFNDAT